MGPSDVEDAIAHMGDPAYIDMMYGPVMDAISDCVRGLFVAPAGKDLVAVDFSAIEARVLAWLASEEKVLEIFRTHGKIYEHAAAGIYRVAMELVTKAQRQIGKVAVLALGYGGGVGAFQSMAKNYGIKIPDEQADEIKKAWRDVHPFIVGYWLAIETAAMNAVYTGGVHTAGRHGRHVTFKVDGSFLWCRLPSGRTLCYPYPEIRTVETPWGAEREALTYMTVVEGKKTKCLEDPASKGSWQRISTYGGSLVENVTQAVARDLLAHSMFNLESSGFPVVAHIHDEAVVEIASSCDADTLGRIETLFAKTPAWAAGLPVSAEGWRARRYRK
jgi:DNA polymerase